MNLKLKYLKICQFFFPSKFSQTKIPRDIIDEEVLVHFIYDRHFQKKIVREEKLISKDIFIPNKGGVSLQRNSYCTENECKSRAKKIQNTRIYKGFLLFRKADFERVKKSYQTNERPEFDAEIKSTPLDEHFKVIPNGIQIFTNSLGNPSHADLEYINPSAKGDETPKTAIRSFSRKLGKTCILALDSNPLADIYTGPLFKTLV